MSAHTPGPWSRVLPLGSRCWTLGKIVDHIAKPLPEENFDADWRLAEAAPDLLAFVERLVAEKLLDEGDGDALPEALRLIARAKGGGK